MKILVTGGAGFIGSNLVEALVEKRHEVIVVDNLFLGTEGNLAKVMKDVNFFKGDLRDKELIKNISKDCDFIFHEAAASSAPMFFKDPTESFSSTVDGFLNILHAAKENNVKRVIYASSSSVYCKLKPPHREDMQVIPIDLYTLSKIVVEKMAKIYTDLFGLETVGFRYFSVYGPHEKAKGKYANIISQFLWDMKKGISPVIYGDGTQTRDFIYVKDVIQANLLAMDMKKKIAGEVFNVGGGSAKSFNDIVEILNKVLETSLKPKYVKNPIKNYVMHTLADTKKAKTILGFEAKYSLEQGLNEIKELN